MKYKILFGDNFTTLDLRISSIPDYIDSIEEILNIISKQEQGPTIITKDIPSDLTVVISE